MLSLPGVLEIVKYLLSTCVFCYEKACKKVEVQTNSYLLINITCIFDCGLVFLPTICRLDASWGVLCLLLIPP